MDTASPTVTTADYIERLEQAVRVMEGLSETERANFDISVVAVRREQGICACIAGLCGFDAWFQAQGFVTTVGESGGFGDITQSMSKFFGTVSPFVRCHYGFDRDITVEDGIAALRQAIGRFQAEPEAA